MLRNCAEAPESSACVAHRCAYRDAAAVECFDLIERQAVDINDLRRALHVELHQVE
jgi:hypothetical protein